MVNRLLLRLTVCALLMLPAACGGASSPAAPTSGAGTAPINVTGLWSEPGGSLTLELKQSGSTVTGTSTFTDRNAVFGSYQGNGTVSGTISGSVLTSTEVYQLIAFNGDSLAGCVETVTTTMTLVSEKQMSGPFTQTDTCNGAVVFSKNGASTVVRP